MKLNSIATLLAMSISNAALASDSVPFYQGCYEVKSGYVETLATSLFTDGDGVLRQQGTFRVELENEENLPDGVSDSIEIELGTVVGEFTGNCINLDEVGDCQTPPLENELPILLHTLTNVDRTGIIVSATGFLTSFHLDQEMGCVAFVTESLLDFTGYGVYGGLDLTSFLEVEGTINFCTGQNTFDVINGRLCFSSAP